MPRKDRFTESADARRELEKSLRPGESLLWSGRPRTGLRLVPSDRVAIPFGLFFLGFSVFWIVGATEQSGGVSVFPLFGIPFVIVGLYVAFGRFFVDAWRRGRTIYGITNKRAIVVMTSSSRRTKSQDLSSLTDLGLDELGDGSGSITLGPWGSSEEITWQFGSQSSNQHTPALAFRHLEKCADVYDILAEAKRQAG